MRLPPLHRRWLCLLLAWTLVWAPLAVWAGWSHPHAHASAPSAAAGGELAHCGSADPVAPAAPELACPCPADACDCLMALPSALPDVPLAPAHARWAAPESPPPPLWRASRHLQPLLRPPAG